MDDESAASPVHVKANDYEYDGWLVATFTKRSRQVRCVVEDGCGRLFIHNPRQLTPRNEDGPRV